ITDRMRAQRGSSRRRRAHGALRLDGNQGMFASGLQMGGGGGNPREILGPPDAAAPARLVAPPARSRPLLACSAWGIAISLRRGRLAARRRGKAKQAARRPRNRVMELTAPNLLTLMRIALVPVLVWLLTYPAPGPSAVAAGVFFVATLSDFFDGYLARSYGSGTTPGQVLRPLAGKVPMPSPPRQ